MKMIYIKWGKGATKRRRQVVQETRPWEKAPMYRKGQAHYGTVSLEPAAETWPEATEALSAAVSTQLTRQCKMMSQKKVASKTRAQG